ncbi:MAG: hypothetical protein JZU47_16775 [Prolixibacteraceae bacterium]|nr:hypothetical protein [Prolixibacteraceae bacterium]
MKNLTLLVLLLLVYTGFSQQKQAPDAYLNSVKIDLNKVFLNPKSIDSIKIEKKTPQGTIYILTKNRKFATLTLRNIVNKHTDIKYIDNSILFRIEGKLIEDTTEIKIDDSYFIYVDVASLSGVKYLDDKFRDLKIINIDLDETERKPQIMLRGNEDIWIK